MDKTKWGRRPPLTYREATVERGPGEQFDQFEASSLFCPQCRKAVAVRKRLLLVLPDGERYEYLCSLCSKSIGKKVEEVKKKVQIVYTP